MSTQLEQEEQLNSIAAVRDFKSECIGDYDYKVNANVIVFDCEEDDEDSLLHNIYVDVQVELGTNFHKVYIMWEQKFGEDFKKVDPKLFGTYSTSYYQMEYNYKEIIIFSDERKIVIRV